MLSAEDCAAWLTENGLVAEPYGKPLAAGAGYARLAVPRSDEQVEAAATCLAQLSGGAPALLQMEDWAVHTEDTFPCPLTNLLAAGETKPPCGIAFTADAAKALADCAAFILNRGQTAYLYLVGPGLSVLLWEGDLIEIWGRSTSETSGIAAVLGDIWK